MPKSAFFIVAIYQAAVKQQDAPLSYQSGNTSTRDPELLSFAPDVTVVPGHGPRTTLRSQCISSISAAVFEAKNVHDSTDFVLVTCQPGAEGALKDEVALSKPDWKFSYSRPGFLTFKVHEPSEVAEPIVLHSTFARASAHSLGRVQGFPSAMMAKAVWQRVGERAIDRLHVWSRDAAIPGENGYESGEDEAARAAKELIIAVAPAAGDGSAVPSHLLEDTHRGDLVLDCVVVAPDEWWIGLHRATSRITRWPGGIWPGQPPPEMVSRAYLKMSEALDWMRFPVKLGQRCVELGCAPGGATQALLDRGLRVTGVDPAKVDERVAQRKHFQHLRKRSADVRRRDFEQFQWLVADMSVAPSYTLAAVRDIVCHRHVNIRGLIMNLKLPDWKLAAEIPGYVAEVRRWGYPVVRARQLSHNGQEICVAGLKPARRGRPPRRKRARSAISARPSAGNRA